MTVQSMGRKSHSTVITQCESAAKSGGTGQKTDGKSLPGKGISMNVREESDGVLMRREIARKRARKAVQDAWAGDRKIDEDIDKRKDHLAELGDEISRRTGRIMGYEDKMAELKEEYDIDEESQIQKNLLMKREQSLENPEIVLTPAEKAQLAEIDEYEARVHEMERAIHEIRTEQKTGLQIQVVLEEAEIASIAAIRMEQVKYDEMLKAQKAAGKIEASAGEDIFGMLIDESKEHIEDTLEEKREEAREKAEKEGKQEERLEARRVEKEIRENQLEMEQTQKRETEEARIEQAKNAREQEDILTDVEKRSTGTASTSSQTRIEVRQMLHKMNLLEEDLKGIEVDDIV